MRLTEESALILMLWSLLLLGVYRPSEGEQEWIREDATNKICEIATRPSQVYASQRALLRDPSYLSYIDNKPIEPLSGVGRHPFARVGCGLNDSIFNISYLILANECHSVPPKKAFLYDLGCADFKPGTKSASGKGSSIPLFMNLYEHRCLKFDKIFGWEARKFPNWWSKVPPQLRPRIRFHNAPVTAAAFERNIATRSREDFVVVKLDIDHLDTELQIIEVIRNYSYLVDELYFEYHFYFDGLDFGWHTKQDIKHLHNASSALRLMTDLREKGIRAHFWV